MAIAMAMASVIVGIGLEMVVPGLVGHWLDTRLGTRPVLVLLGFLLGMMLAGWHLAKVVGNLSANQARRDKRKQL